MRILALWMAMVGMAFGQNAVLYESATQTLLQTNIFGSNVLAGAGITVTKGAKGVLTISSGASSSGTNFNGIYVTNTIFGTNYIYAVTTNNVPTAIVSREILTNLLSNLASGETNYNGEVSVTNATKVGWVYGKVSVTNLLRSSQAGNGMALTNQGTNVMFAIDPAIVASQSDLTAASNAIISLLIANDTITSNGLVSFSMTMSNTLRTTFTANDTTTSNGAVAFAMTVSNALAGIVGETNFNGEASVTNAGRFGWVFGKTGITNLLRSITPAYGMTGTNESTNVSVAIDPAIIASQTDLNNASNALRTTSVNGLTNKIDNQTGRGTNTTLMSVTNMSDAVTAVAETVVMPSAGRTNLVEYQSPQGTIISGVKSNGAFLLPIGTNNFPALGWLSEDDGTGMGLYRSAASQMSLSENGSEVFRFGSTPFLSARATGGYFDINTSVSFYRVGAANAGIGTGAGSGFSSLSMSNALVMGGVFATQASSFAASVTNATASTTAVPETVVGASGHITNLVEWQMPAGTIVSIVKSNGAVMLPAGTANFPAIGWLADDDGSGTGLYRGTANAIDMSSSGTQIARFNGSGIGLGGGSVYFGSSVTADDIQFMRQASGELRFENGTSANALTNDVMGTRTGTGKSGGAFTNAEWLELGYDGAQGWFFLRSQKGSSNGTARPLVLSANGVANDWRINTNHTVAVANDQTNYGTIYSELGTTNAIIMLDTNGTTRTRLYTQGGTLYSSASPSQRTVGSDEWDVVSGRAITTGIDGTATGNTPLVLSGGATTVPAGRQLIVQQLIVIPTTVTALVTPPTISIGKTAASYSDVIVASALTSLSAVNLSTILLPTVGATVLQAGDTLNLRVSVGAVGTAYTFKVIVVGLLL